MKLYTLKKKRKEKPNNLKHSAKVSNGVISDINVFFSDIIDLMESIKINTSKRKQDFLESLQSTLISQLENFESVMNQLRSDPITILSIEFFDYISELDPFWSDLKEIIENIQHSLNDLINAESEEEIDKNLDNLTGIFSIFIMHEFLISGKKN